MTAIISTGVIRSVYDVTYNWGLPRSAYLAVHLNR